MILPSPVAPLQSITVKQTGADFIVAKLIAKLFG